jgi:hypothetical protein
MTHTRWHCATCAREWVYAHHWSPEQGCPGCHSSQVTQVTYQPLFPGGDLPRDPVAPTPPAVVIVEEERNWAIELSGVRI